MSRKLSPTGVPRPVVIVALALGVLLAAGVAVLGVVSRHVATEQREAAQAQQEARRTGPLALPPVPAPDAGSSSCTAVLRKLPASLLVGRQRVPRRALAKPAPPATVVWGDARHDPITLRCGIESPAELTPTSPLVQISGVQWLQLSEGGASTWVAVDRPVRIALTVPEGSGSGPVQDMSAVVGRTLPARPVFP